MLILTMPILLPIVKQLGFHPIWFGIVAVLMVEAALITPPVGLNVYVIGGVAKDTSLATIFRGVTPFLLGILVVEIIITVFPSICLVLPGMMK
jgi:TRAP-type C4-dicarboxylate transport system permease large subunit